MPDETRTGVAGPALREASWNAAYRAGGVGNALLNGAITTQGKNAFQNFIPTTFAWRATDDEMMKFRSGQSFARRRMANMGFSSESWLATGAAPSLWFTSAEAMANPTSTSRDIWRVINRGGYGNAEDATYFLGGTKDRVAAREAKFKKNKAWGFTGQESDYAGTLSGSKEAWSWTRQSLKLGEAKYAVPSMVGDRLEKYGIYAGAKLKHYVMGAVFNPSGDVVKKYAAKYGAEHAVGAAAAKMGSENLLTRVLGRGEFVAGMAKNAPNVAMEMFPAASNLLRLGGMATRAIPYINMALMAYDVGKLAWKTGDLYFSKMPRAFYRDINSVITRPGFAPVAAGMPDSPVLANNRQRAVAAIQGSRMNARNAIGREASLFAGHFG